MSEADGTKFRPGRVPDQRPGRDGGARAKNRAERTDAICRAALGLFIEQGLETTTVDAITKGAGVAKGSFYRYFEDKTQLVEALFEPLRGAMRDAFERCEGTLSAATGAAEMTAAYQGLASDLAHVFLGSPDLARVYLQEHRGADDGPRQPIRALAREIGAHALRLTELAHERELLRPLPPRVTAVAVVSAAEGLLFATLDGDELGAPDEVVGALVAMVLQGLAPTG